MRIVCVLLSEFDVRKSVHHHTIQINQPTRCNKFNVRGSVHHNNILVYKSQQKTIVLGKKQEQRI